MQRNNNNSKAKFHSNPLKKNNNKIQKYDKIYLVFIKTDPIIWNYHFDQFIEKSVRLSGIEILRKYFGKHLVETIIYFWFV